MITRGSKYFYAAALVGVLSALVYGFITEAASQGGIVEVVTGGGLVDAIVGPLSVGWKGGVGDQIGYSILLGFAGTMLVLGGMASAFRDGSAAALAEVQGAKVEGGEVVGGGADLRIATPTGLSYWPVLGAVSLGAIIIGAAISTPLVLIGVIGLVVVVVEWTVRAWSERATGDPALNREIRNKFMYPVEVPVGATLLIGVVVYCMSRILLAIPKVGAVFFIIIAAVLVFGVAVFLAGRPQLKRSVLVSVLVFGGLAIVAGGIAAGIAGPREEAEEGPAHQTSIEHGGAPAGD
jgi:hypothetical protein